MSRVGEMNKDSSKGKFCAMISLRKTCLNFPKHFQLREVMHVLILNTLKVKLIMDGLLYKTKEHLTNWGYGFLYIFVLFILPEYYQVFWVFQVLEHVYRAPPSITAT